MSTVTTNVATTRDLAGHRVPCTPSRRMAGVHWLRVRLHLHRRGSTPRELRTIPRGSLNWTRRTARVSCSRSSPSSHQRCGPNIRCRAERSVSPGPMRLPPNYSPVLPARSMTRSRSSRSQRKPTTGQSLARSSSPVFDMPTPSAAVSSPPDWAARAGQPTGPSARTHEPVQPSGIAGELQLNSARVATRLPG